MDVSSSNRGSVRISGNFQCTCCGQGDITPNVRNALTRMAEENGIRIIVTSGYRCAKHNAAVGGAPKSAHLRGDAADIISHSLTPLALGALAKTYFPRVLLYKTHAHVGF